MYLLSPKHDSEILFSSKGEPLSNIKIHIPDFPHIPDIPHIPHIPDIPDIPHIPDIPEIFDLGISSQTGFFSRWGFWHIFLGGVFGTTWARTPIPYTTLDECALILNQVPNII